MRIIRGCDQLHIDAHLIICFLDATFQEIGDAELVRNLGGTLRRVRVTLRRRTRDHFEIRDLREPGQDLVLDPVCEIGVGFIFTQAFKWQNSDGFFIS